MFIYRFSDGHQITTRLDIDEVMRRMNRLDTLRVMTEGYESGEGRSICRKALAAYDKEDNFTGIIRLTTLEKDFLSYMLESDMLTDEEIAVINYYLKY